MTIHQPSAFLERRVSQTCRRSLLAIAVAGLALAGCGPGSTSQAVPDGPSASGEAAKDAGSIRALLQQCDVAKLTVALQDVLGWPSSAEVLGLLNDVWIDEAVDPAAAACMKREVVRVYVANTLAQAQANRMIELSQLPSVLDALRAALDSQSSEVVQIALMGLGDFLVADDVQRVGRIAAGPNPANARVAVSALATACAPEADQELSRLSAANGVLSPEEIATIRKSVQAARRIKCGPPKV